jgi:hypothetical protein
MLLECLLVTYLFSSGTSFHEQVLKFLMEKNSINALHGQVTVGTLILQVCGTFFIFNMLIKFFFERGVCELANVISFLRTE